MGYKGIDMNTMNTESLSSCYCVETDSISKEEWETLMLQFRDATINQTWSFGAGLSGGSNLSHLVLKRDNEVVAAAQVRIETLPIIRAGIAYLGWGPMWQRWDREDNLEDFQQIVKSLRDEYATKRGLLLTVLPNKWDSDSDANVLGSILTTEAFQWRQSSHRTLLVNLEPSLDDLRRQLRQRWRNYLKRVEKENMLIHEGCGDDLFDKFKGIYKEMHARKKYPADIDIEKYAAIQRDLPDALKLRILLCESNGELMAGAVFSTIGDTGIYSLGATSNKGIKSRASYLIHWRMVRWLKENGYRTYDLGGTDPEKTPGTYQFKAGICGKDAEEVRRVGEFVACESAVSSSVVKCGYLGRRSALWLKAKIKTTR